MKHYSGGLIRASSLAFFSSFLSFSYLFFFFFIPQVQQYRTYSNTRKHTAENQGYAGKTNRCSLLASLFFTFLCLAQRFDRLRKERLPREGHAKATRSPRKCRANASHARVCTLSSSFSELLESNQRWRMDLMLSVTLVFITFDNHNHGK